MNLDALPNGSSVFVDANIVLYALEHKSASCRRFLARCEAREIAGVFSTVTIAEIADRRMVEEARSIGLAGSNPARALSQRPDLIRQLRAYAEDVRDLLAGDMTVETVLAEDFFVALEIQKQHGLLTNDSLHLAVARRIGIDQFATADACYDSVSGITIYKPADLVSA